MINLKAIIEDCEKEERLREVLRKSNAPHSTLRYFDGVIRTYRKIIKGDYDKK